MDNIVEFIEGLHEELNKKYFAPSITYIKRKYFVQYGKEISEDVIDKILSKDSRFIKINDSQYVSRSKFEEYINSLISTIGTDNENFIINKVREKYFTEKVESKLLQNYLKAKQNFKYKIKTEEPIICFKEERYKVSCIEDIVSIGLNKGYLSYEVIEKASLYFDIWPEDIIDELDYKGIKIIKTKDVEFKYSTDDKFYITKNNTAKLDKNQTYINYYNANSNILLIDLRINELIACIFVLTYLEEILNCFDNKYINQKYLNEIDRLGIAKVSDNRIKITPLGEKIIFSFRNYLEITFNKDYKKDLLNNYHDTRQLCKSSEIKELVKDEKMWNRIAKPMRDLFLSHDTVRNFMKLISDVNKIGKNSMFDLFEYSIKNEKEWELKNILIGNKATSGIKPITNGKDVCFSCKNKKCKISTGNIKNKLLFYRYKYVDAFIKECKKNNKQYKKILDDPLLIKFLVPYTVVVSLKIVLTKINFLKRTNILYKNRGIYCPKKDKWVIENDTLLQ